MLSELLFDVQFERVDVLYLSSFTPAAQVTPSVQILERKSNLIVRRSVVLLGVNVTD